MGECDVRLMTVVKTTVNIDEKLWEEFKRTLSNRYGGLRNLSGVVEGAIRNYNLVEVFRESASKLGIELEYPSSEEVEARRPSISVDSYDVLNEIHKGRQARLHEQ